MRSPELTALPGVATSSAVPAILPTSVDNTGLQRYSALAAATPSVRRPQQAAMISPDDIVHVPDFLLAAGLGTEAVLALLAPLCGAGWGMWTVYLVCASLGLAVSVRFLWSR